MAASKSSSITQRILTGLGQTTLTLVFVGAAGFALVFGVGLLNDRAAAVPDPEAAPAVPVSVTTISFEEGYTLPRRFVGQIEPRASVSLSFELGGRVEALRVEEGDTVHAGQEIARLDTRILEADATRLNASRAAAQAQLVAAEARLVRATRLQKEGFASEEVLDQALAARDELLNRIAETDASLSSVQINIEKSVITAPFDGRIASQSIDGTETVQPGQEIVMVMETSAPELRVGLPLDVSRDALETVEIDLAGETIPATLKRLRPDIDPVTRTRTALFALDAAPDVIFGQTAALTLRSPIKARGTWVPVDALQSGEGSVWSLLLVVDDKLARAAVEILHIEDRQAFVRGTLQDGAQIVTSGAHRVVAGQTVTVVDEDA
ncbi:MAG: efflux RND transporter periplasmic adaptor subunit [Pseudomonadota bacterium]